MRTGNILKGYIAIIALLATLISPTATGEISEEITYFNQQGKDYLKGLSSLYGSQTSPPPTHNINLMEMSEQGKIKSSQLIVKFKNATAAAMPAMNSVLQRYSIKNISGFYTPNKILAAYKEAFSNLKVISFTKGTNLNTAFQELQKDPEVEYVLPNFTFSLQATPNDLTPRQWGLNNNGQEIISYDYDGSELARTGKNDADINAPEAWDIRHDASNTIIAVIDTGVDYNHEDLAANMWSNPGEIAGNGIDDDGNGYIDDIHGYDFADNDPDPMDAIVSYDYTNPHQWIPGDFSTGGHGTHCAGIIAATGNNGTGITGVAWNTKIMALKIFGDGEPFAFTSDIVSAILYAADNGAKISNNSYGSTTPNSAWANAGNKPLFDAISAANDAGMLFVAAAGNNGADLNQEAYTTPAGFELPNIISVAASDENDELASFSNYGSSMVDIAAPGVDIYSTFPENRYRNMSGTSMAAPMVAGTAALLAEQHNELTPAEIKAIIMNTSDRLDSLTGSSATDGRLNTHNALKLLHETSGGSCESFADTNDNHVAAGRAEKSTSGQTCWGTFCYGGTTTYKAKGSDESLGSYGFTNTTLFENEPGFFSKTENCQMGGTIDAPPVITINGDNEKYILVGTQYILPSIEATATDREDGDITSAITTSGSFDTNEPGRYMITYTAEDSAGNKAAPVTRSINVLEQAYAPGIVINGPSCNGWFCTAQKMIKDTEYQEFGFIAFDLLDGDLTDDVYIIGGNMDDTSSEGIRFLNYRVTNSNGIEGGTVNGAIRLVAVLDEEYPHIWIRNPEGGNYFEYANEFYTWKRPDGDTSWYYSPNFTIVDMKTDRFYDPEYPNEEMDYSDWGTYSITGRESVDYTASGSYTVTFTATDTEGNSKEAQQTIHVIEDLTSPTITLRGDTEIDMEIGDFYQDPWFDVTDDLDHYPSTSRKYYDESGSEIDNPFSGRTLSAGRFTIEYLAQDGAGNQAEPQYRTVNVIRSHWNHEPVFESWRIKNFAGAKISGTTFDIDGDLNRVEIEFDGNGNWIQATGTENFEYIPDFYGKRQVRFRVVDDNGNMTSTDTYDFYPTAPVVIDSRSLHIDGNSITVTGTASDDENDITHIQIKIDRGEWLTCEGTNNYTCTANGLDFGEHYYTIRGIDAHGLAYTSTPRHYFDINPALPQIDSFEYAFEGDTLVVNGTASDSDGDLKSIQLIAVGGSSFDCTGTASFTCEMTDLIANQNYDMVLEAKDAFGNNSAPKLFSFTYIPEENTSCFTATNSNHIDAGRAELRYGVLVYANGSGNYLGMGTNETSLEETSPGVWTKVNSCN